MPQRHMRAPGCLARLAPRLAWQVRVLVLDERRWRGWVPLLAATWTPSLTVTMTVMVRSTQALC